MNWSDVAAAVAAEGDGSGSVEMNGYGGNVVGASAESYKNSSFEMGSIVRPMFSKGIYESKKTK